MEYRVEDISPVKKKVFITLDSEVVNKEFARTTSAFKSSVKIDGFRKGKVPISIIEQRFHDDIINEVHKRLLEDYNEKVFEQANIRPLYSFLIADDTKVEKDSTFEYAIEFDVLPNVELPKYVEIEVEQKNSVVDLSQRDRFVENLRKNMSKLIPALTKGPGVDGQVLNLDFEAFEDGKPIDGLKVVDYNFPLGENKALESFEELAKTIKVGETKEGEIVFPESFIKKDLAGKTVNMKITVHAIYDYKLPELDDEFAKNLGMDSLEKLYEILQKTALESEERQNKSRAQKDILKKLLDGLKFDLPEILVKLEIQNMISNLSEQLKSQGRTLDSLGKTKEELQSEYKEKAEDNVREFVLLLLIGKKEGLTITGKELESHIYQESIGTNKNFKELLESYIKSGFIYVLQDRLLADKAMNWLYDKAKITMVDELKDEEKDK